MRPADLVYAVDERPPLPQWLLLGLQYAVMVATYLVIVVIIISHAHVSSAVATNVLSLALIAAAIGTALQSLHKGPIGAGFLAPPVFSAIYLAPSVLAAEIGGLPLVFGMTIFAGLIEIVLAFALRRLRVIFQPILSGLTVFVVGLQLGLVGIGEVLDVTHVDLAAFPLHVAVTTLTLGVCIALSIWGKGAIRLFCSLAGLSIGVISAASVGMIGAIAQARIDAAPLFQVPGFDSLSYSFQPGLIPAFLAAALAATLRTVGVVTTCQRINDAAWKRPDMGNIRKGILADGLGSLIGGLLGAPGMNIAPSLVSISGATGATSRVIAYVAAAILLLLAFLPKLAAAFLALPLEVAGAVLVFTASFMITSGMQIILSRTPDTRAIYVIGISTLLALSKKVFPDYFTALSPLEQSLASSPLALGLMAAVALTLLFRFGTTQTAVLTLAPGEDADGRVGDFIRHQAAQWKVDAEAAENCRASIVGVLAYLKAHALHDSDITLRARFDGIDLVLAIDYRGRMIPAAGVQVVTREPSARTEDLQDEEAPAYVGLRNFLRNIHADQKHVASQGPDVRIRLRFAV